MPKRKPTFQYPQLCLSVEQVAQLIGETPNTVRAKAERGELPAHQKGSGSPYKFYLPELLKFFGGEHSLQDCLAFYQMVVEPSAYLTIKRLEQELAREHEEKARMREKLQQIVSAVGQVWHAVEDLHETKTTQ